MAFGALGTPIIALGSVTGIDPVTLGAMAGRQLPFFSLLVPFWVVWAFAGFRGMLGVWPAALVAGLSFAIPQFLVSNFHGPWLVDIVASLSSILAVLLLLRKWRPSRLWSIDSTIEKNVEARTYSRNEIARAWVPWCFLSVFVFIWGIPWCKNALNDISVLKWNVPWLHNVVVRSAPVALNNKPESAIFVFNWLSATGTGILAAGVVSGLFMRFKPLELIRLYGQTIYCVRFSLLTIAAMLSLGYVTKYCGSDATLGLALAHTGSLYPFFGTLLGWLGVALTGSDTASKCAFWQPSNYYCEADRRQPGINGGCK